MSDVDLQDIKKIVSEAIYESTPKETKYSVDEIIKHQMSCQDGNCPACSAIHAEKQKNLERGIINSTKKLSDILDLKISEVNKSKYTDCMNKAAEKCTKKYNKPSFLARTRAKIGKRITGNQPETF